MSDTQPMKYRKKPVVIEAYQLTDTNAIEVMQWLKSFGVDVVMRGGPEGGWVGRRDAHH